MKNIIKLTIVIILLLTCFGAKAADSPKVIAVVVSKNCPVSNLTMKELQDIYLRRRVRVGGSDMEPINRESDSDMRLAFDQAVLKMSSDESKKYWISMRIKGEGGPPKTMSSALAVRRFVAKMDGKSVSSFGIGYIDMNDLDDSVKLLTIEGIKLPADADAKSQYPLITK